ncbi:MAG: transposase [Candidatus Dormibacteria bacterium]
MRDSRTIPVRGTAGLAQALAQRGTRRRRYRAGGGEDLVTFYDFPEEHWFHLRTSNPIESIFAGVRLRTDAT